MRGNYVLILILVLLIPFLAKGQDGITAARCLDSARTAYDKGNYGQALGHYRKVAEHYSSPSLFYNMGNAALQKGELGSAILYYRKAEERAPWDPDLQHNLGIALERTRDDFKGEWKKRGVLSGIEDFVVEQPIGGWWTLAFIASLLSGGMAVLIALRKRNSQPSEWSLLFLFLFLSGSFYGADRWREGIIGREKGVVIRSPSVKVRSEPRQNASTAFVLHEGTTVDLRGQQKGWIEIRTPDDQVGWVRSEKAAAF